ncbi:hypothetical protein QAD02_015859 [Eretmocerus hayati]|uniref:Uncharacterized protein n=1 Tax=Eretmocerus hayati TaxID=131215 RepID=A0ACC2P9F3_9HYME|nr:hypothetical protein QAD02_015859 [Eretmocerus hayati]
MILPVALFPTEDAVEVFELLREHIPEDSYAIYDYFYHTYVRGKPRRARARVTPPLYPISLWNQYEAVIHGLHKTNYSSEGWIHRFALVVGKKHPDFYSCLKEFQEEQRDSETCLVELGLVLEYLDAMSHNITIV